MLKLDYNKSYCFDLDNTLCSQEKDYTLAKPFKERISKVNKLYEQENKITIYSSRGMDTFNGDVKMCYNKYYNLTRNQLVEWGVKFDVLLLGKPAYDLFIDDKARNDKEFFGD